MHVFFYGLFMDIELLAEKGIVPSSARSAVLEGYRLRIGERATLLPEKGARAYGLVMEVDPLKIVVLYAEESVADYVPEPVQVSLEDGSQIKATCYNLPVERVAGTNAAYAEKLHALANKLGFPEPYLAEIRGAGR